MCFRILTILSPRRVVNPKSFDLAHVNQGYDSIPLPSKIRWGYDSLTVPRIEPGISWRSTTLCRENEAVGPWGK